MTDVIRCRTRPYYYFCRAMEHRGLNVVATVALAAIAATGRVPPGLAGFALGVAVVHTNWVFADPTAIELVDGDAA